MTNGTEGTMGEAERRVASGVRGIGPLLAAVLAALVLSGSPAAGQVAWESPLLVHPHVPAGWSVFLMDPHPGDDVGVMASWRTAPRPVGFGVRAGLGEGAGGDLAVFGGLDASGTIVEYTDEAPLDLIWVLGGGLSISDHLLISFPAALMAGWNLSTEAADFRPYVGPRVVLDAWMGDDSGRGRGGDDDLDLELAVDLGLDVAFNGGWVVRFGVSAGDREALAVGLALPAPGRRR